MFVLANIFYNKTVKLHPDILSLFKSERLRRRQNLNNSPFMISIEKESGEDTKTKFTKKMKGLLRSDEDRRTSEDRTLIRRLIGNLKCLHRYPVHVRENLATAAMFSYFGPGRKLVSEGHPSVAMYFIISGEANVSKMTFDPGVREERSINVGVMEAGESFGEVNSKKKKGGK